jgi:hypothetical protein
VSKDNTYFLHGQRGLLKEAIGLALTIAHHHTIVHKPVAHVGTEGQKQTIGMTQRIAKHTESILHQGTRILFLRSTKTRICPPATPFLHSLIPEHRQDICTST